MKFFSLSTILLATAATAAPTFTRDNATPTCMAKGMKVKQWTAKDFSLSTDNKVSFTLVNGALTYKATCTAQAKSKSAYDGKTTYPCKIDAAAAGDTSFTYNSKTNTLGVSQTWSCVSEGGRISAEGSGTVKPQCTTTTAYGKSTTTCKPVTATIPVTTMSAVL